MRVNARPALTCAEAISHDAGYRSLTTVFNDPEAASLAPGDDILARGRTTTVRQFEAQLDDLIIAALQGGLYPPAVMAVLESKVRALRNEATDAAVDEADHDKD
jgi:hypothetical protein